MRQLAIVAIVAFMTGCAFTALCNLLRALARPITPKPPRKTLDLDTPEGKREFLECGRGRDL